MDCCVVRSFWYSPVLQCQSLQLTLSYACDRIRHGESWPQSVKSITVINYLFDQPVDLLAQRARIVDEAHLQKVACYNTVQQNAPVRFHVAMRSNGLVCGRSTAGIEGLKPAAGMDFLLLYSLFG
jgi:hypothetical protein